MFLYVLDRVQERIELFFQTYRFDKIHDLIVFLLERGKAAT